jgi:hypothetical protein
MSIYFCKIKNNNFFSRSHQAGYEFNEFAITRSVQANAGCPFLLNVPKQASVSDEKFC